MKMILPRSAWREATALLLLALVPALATGWGHPLRPVWTWARPAVPEVALAALKPMAATVLWVDARPAEAYVSGHIPGAIALNEDEWERLLPSLLSVWQPGQRIVVYCDSSDCATSQAVALRLQRELQIETVAVLRGGWKSWQEATHR